MAYDLKSITADSSFADGNVLFGADDQTSATPVPYSAAGIKAWIDGAAHTFLAAQIVNLNAASAPANAGGSVFQLVGADSNSARYEADSFAASSFFTARRANGTGASPTAIANADQLGGFNAHGYYVTGGPAYSGVQATLAFMATQAWTSTANGTQILLRTTPNNSTTLTTAVTIDQDQSVSMAGAATVSGKLTNSLGTITTSQPATFTQTWNAGGVTFTGALLNVTNSASASGSKIFDFQVGSISAVSADAIGALYLTSQHNAFNPTIKFLQGAADATVAAQVISESSASLTIIAGLQRQATFGNGAGGIATEAGYFFGWAPSTDTRTTADTMISRGGAAASVQFGAQDAAVAVAQTTRVQSVVAGTADVAGANWTLKGSVSTGSAASGNWTVQVGGKGAASTTQNTLQDALTIVGATTNNTNVGRPSVVVGNSALATNATDGFLYIPTCAGTPTGTPTAATGRIPMVYDTTNHQFWFYDGSWLQPKTPAGAAIVTWQ